MKAVAQLVVAFCDDVYRETGKYPETIVLPPEAYVDFMEGMGPAVVYVSEGHGDYATLASGTRVCIPGQVERNAIGRATEYIREHAPGALRLIRSTPGAGVRALFDILDWCDTNMWRVPRTTSAPTGEKK